MNTINKQAIALKKRHGVVIEANDNQSNLTHALTLNAEMLQLGYCLSQAALTRIASLSVAEIGKLAGQVLCALREFKGANVSYHPMYPGFPQQVIEASQLALYQTALQHYWSNGSWRPEYGRWFRAASEEVTKPIAIDLVGESTFIGVFTQLLESNESLCDADKNIVEWFLLHYPLDQLDVPEDIPFAENKCIVAAYLLAQDKDISALVKTATDILRIVTYLSEGDISLATNTQFISLPRVMRKKIVLALQKVINEEDIGRHRKKWVRLFHGLHVGEYSETVYAIAKKAREGESLQSFYGDLERAWQQGKEKHDMSAVIMLLRQRPGEFARQLDRLLRSQRSRGNRLARFKGRKVNSASQRWQVVTEFLAVAEQVPTRVLLQVKGHFSRRFEALNERVVFPKGHTQKAIVVRQRVEAIEPDVLEHLLAGIESVLVARFATLQPLGNVWIDPALAECPVPSQQRSAASGLHQVARGTRFALGDKNTLRFFIYWVGRDIDLSASFHDDNFALLSQVSYTHLKSDGYKAVHSGDITHAPDGACEFIDITLDGALRQGARYLVMNVFVYSGPVFADHDVCFAGWMTRDYPDKNAVFDAKTVEQKIDITSRARNAIPVVFDLLERQAIWVDLVTASATYWGGNNIESNQASITEKLAAIVTMNHKVSLYELFALHAQGRGKQVTEPERAEHVFAWQGNVTPYDIDVIQADYMG